MSIDMTCARGAANFSLDRQPRAEPASYRTSSRVHTCSVAFGVVYVCGVSHLRYLNIYRRIRRTHGNCRHQLGAHGPGYNILGGNTPNHSSCGHIPAQSTIQRPHTTIQHIPAPGLLTRTGVPSEPPEGMNKNTAGSHT